MWVTSETERRGERGETDDSREAEPLLREKAQSLLAELAAEQG